MPGVQPASSRLLFESVAAATYATPAQASSTATTAANNAVNSAVAALPKGIVSTARGVNLPANLTLTAGRLYRITAHVQPSLNASVIAGARIHGIAGATAPAVNAGTVITPIAYSPINGTGGTGFPSLFPSGVFAVTTTGAFSFSLQITPATGSTSGFNTISGALEYVLEDVGQTGAAGTGRAPAVTL